MDASVVVSAALAPLSIPARAAVSAQERCSVALSDAVYSEIAGVLGRPKFIRDISPKRRFDVLSLLVSGATWWSPAEPVSDCRDAKDNKYLELALAARAEVIVSGDDDLLSLDPWRGVRILSPGDFLPWLG